MAVLECRFCGHPFEGNPRRRYCSTTCSGRAYRERHPRTTTERGLGHEYQQARKIVLERDPWCVYCGAPSTTADHVIPRSAGGASTVDNLVGSCEPCNRAKGAGSLPPGGPDLSSLPPHHVFVRWEGRWQMFHHVHVPRTSDPSGEIEVMLPDGRVTRWISATL